MLQPQRSGDPVQRPATPRTDFRADADECGRWFVWRRLGATGWAAWRQCTSRSDAIHMAAALNRQAPPIPN